MDKVTIYRVLWSTLKLDATNRHGLADVITLEDHRRALDAERERLKGQIDYSIQLQQLIESLRRDDTPSPELYHHKIIVEFKRQLATLQAQLAAAKKVKADYDRWLSGGVYFATAEYEKHVADHGQQVEALQAQLRQVEGERDEWERKCRDLCQAHGVLLIEHHDIKKELATLRQLVEALPVVDGRMDVECGACYYIRSFVAEQYGVVCGLITEQATAMAIKALLEYRATLAAQDAGKVSTSIIGKQVPPSQWDKNAEVRGDIS